MKPIRHLTLGLLLTGCAGFVDAIGFIVLGGYYTSFMSGNTTQLGTAGLMGTSIWLPLGLVAMFFIGSFIGSLIFIKSGRRGPFFVLVFVIATMLAVLALAASQIPITQAMLVLAAGAGAQNATLPFSGGARLGTTFVSGTLYSAGQDLAGAVAGTIPRWRWIQQLSVWAALLLGALAGAIVHNAIGVNAVIVPGLVYLVMAIGFAIRSPV